MVSHTLEERRIEYDKNDTGFHVYNICKDKNVLMRVKFEIRVGKRRERLMRRF